MTEGNMDKSVSSNKGVKSKLSGTAGPNEFVG